MQKAAKKSTNWLEFIAGLVAANPKMSALIAFELGQLAGRATLDAAGKYKSLKPKIGEARDYLAAQIPSASPLSALKLLHAPGVPSKKRAPGGTRKTTRKKKSAPRGAH